MKNVKLEELRHALALSASPNRVWTYYTNLIQFLGHEPLPLKTHQEVLRACTPAAADVRVAAMRRISVGNWPKTPHLHEARFQTVVENIRKMGETPSLEDYHFILEQFAATGHHVGSMQVYRELRHQRLQSRTRTYGLCLQSIARRISMPCKKLDRPGVLQEAQTMCREIVEDMQKMGKPLTSVTLDLVTRIMKEAMDAEGFELAIKAGYAIDLSNPDCFPLESALRQPFSTAALNTTLDMLGQLGNISKLVQTFEVLTQPLPTSASERISSSFDDEDDDFGVSEFPPPAPQSPPPHAVPNTTSYNLLLKHISRAGNLHLARHYLLQAMELDRTVARQLRGEIMLKPLDLVSSPNFSLNRGMLLSPFGEANRDKNLETMKWLQRQLHKILRRKYNDLYHFTELRSKLLVPDGTTSIFSRPPRTSRSAQSSPPESDWIPGKTYPELETPLDTPPPQPVAFKPFNLSRHLVLLAHDINEITDFSHRLSNVLERTTQRVKERLGRRVWSGRDVYIKTEGRRLSVGRDQWKRIVRFDSKTARRFDNDSGVEVDGGRVETWRGAPPKFLRKSWVPPSESAIAEGEEYTPGMERPVRERRSFR